jgi:hypothetical protein
MKRAVLSVSLFLAAAVLVGPPVAVGRQGARVDLDLYYDEPVVAAGGTGTETFTVANSGAGATAPADLTVTTGVFVTATALPGACAFLYRDADADPTVPQIVRCTVPPLPTGTSVRFPLTLHAAGAAPAGATFGTATVLPRSDVDQHLADNLGFPSVVVSHPGAAGTAPAAAHVTDLYLTTDLPAVAVGAPGTETLTVGNRGPQPGGGPIRLTVGTPPLVRVGTLPAGCAFRYDSPDPGAPQLVSCVLPPLAVAATAVVRLPLAPEFGSPVQTSWGIAGAFPDRADGATDIDPVPANNLVESGVQVIG